MTSAQLTGLLATVGAAFLAQSVACVLLFRQVRRLATRMASGDGKLTGDSAQVVAQLRVLEARLSQVESGLRTSAKSSGPGSGSESKRLRRLDRRQVASADGPVLIAVPSLASTPSTSPTAAAEEFDRRFGAIWSLADSGVPEEEIARQTGFPVGQVELILGLRRPKTAVHGLPVPPSRGGTDA